MLRKKQLSIVKEIGGTSSIDGSSFFESADEDVPIATNNNNKNAKSNANRQTTSEEEYDTMTANESRGVAHLKTVIYLTLIASAFTVAIATYWFVQDEQQMMLGLEMEAITEEAVSGVQDYLDGISSQLQQISTSFSSEYQSSNMDSSASSSWVNLTLPHFDQRIKNHPTSELIFYTPIIPADGSNGVLQLEEWKNYSMQHQGWIDEALSARGWDPLTTEIPEQVYSFPSDGQSTTTTTVSGTDNTLQHDILAPIWQVSPVPRNRSIINLNALSVPALADLWHTSSSSTEPTASEARLSATLDAQYFLDFVEEEENTDEMNMKAPTSFLSVPVFKTFDRNNSPFGYLFALVSWHKGVATAFQESHLPMTVDIRDHCGTNQHATFLVQNDGTVQYHTNEGSLGPAVISTLQQDFSLRVAGCSYNLTIHPTEEGLSMIDSEIPLLGFIMIGLLLIFLVIIFYWYNRVVKERQLKLLSAAKRSNAVVSSLFPEAIQNRLMEEVDEQQPQKPESRRIMLKKSGSMKFNMMQDAVEDEKEKAVVEIKGRPIADFFPETTIMFADIAGFTAWSSMREPTQVFTLLESLYAAFDEIARKRQVFKVETIGDCYVAVVGLPEPNDQHAIVMARFAHDCRIKTNEIVQQLEVTLGPDTTDLAMRIGLHSGPVTAGVLRGDKARFQLFGDTMNTTSRIETTGKSNRIHVSETTADYLMAAGKTHWLSLREDRVTAKGKGELTTYWLRISRGKKGQRNRLSSQASSRSLGSETFVADTLPAKKDNEGGLSDKHMRLVNWITNELAELLGRIEYRRTTLHTYPDPPIRLEELEQESLRKMVAKMPLDEVVDIIELPVFDADINDFLSMSKRGHDVNVYDDVKSELHDYVTSIACMYNDNLFHNFEHASHVTMSVVKLLSRIVTPAKDSDGNANAVELHESTFGIASDPLSQFTVVLSALVHDVDHPGVPNVRLMRENTTLAGRYKKKSIAEQNSTDKSWKLLMDPKYSNLRRSIYQTKSEYKRFRNVLVNAVMATDIMDKEIGDQRKERWDKAFKQELGEDSAISMNRKATVVIEHIIQVSDVAHTTQHWHVYRKWNGRLFEEMYKAFGDKRAASNPADKWYEGEIGFFDFYILPLAKKLKDCGVFGVSSDELLNYAQQNRQEWELTGKRVVSNMAKAVRLETGPLRGVSRFASSDSLTVASLLSPPALRSKRTSGGTKRNASRSPPSVGVRRLSPMNVSPLRSLVRGSSGESSIGVSTHSTSDRKALLRQSEHFSIDLNEDDRSHHSALTTDSFGQEVLDLKLPPELNILIIDDDKLNRKLFTSAVMSVAPQWIVSEVESAEEALGLIEQSVDGFDVIFMDQHAGSEADNLLGSDAVELLREKGVNSLICGMSEGGKEASFNQSAADLSAQKPFPFQPQSFLRELNRIMLQSSGDW